MYTKRVFLALPIEPVGPAAKRMTLLQELLYNYRIKWVRPENFHLTLFFFGEIPGQMIPVLSVLLRWSLKYSSAFKFSITAPGIFKKGNALRVIWLSIKAPDHLIEIKKNIDEAVSALGFIPGDSEFRPHITLGRFLHRQNFSLFLDETLKEIQLAEPMEYYASKLILFESKLLPSGPKYLPIEVFPLDP